MSLYSVFQLHGVFRKLRVGLGRKPCSKDGFLFSISEMRLRVLATSGDGQVLI